MDTAGQLHGELSPLRIAGALDYCGFIPREGESPDGFVLRALRELDRRKNEQLRLEREGGLRFSDGTTVRSGDRVSEDLLREAESLTRRLYSFGTLNLNGYFSAALGPLWGGCMVSDDCRHEAYFLIRRVFKKRRKWLFYDRAELLSHELCHGMRQELDDDSLEEFFAYRTATSKFRAYVGGIFVTFWDTALFMFPAMLLCLAQLLQLTCWEKLALWPFWAVMLAALGFLFTRNALMRRRVFKAAGKLGNWGVKQVWPILFRLKNSEIARLAALRDCAGFERFITAKSDTDTRFALIRFRFLNQEVNNL